MGDATQAIQLVFDEVGKLVHQYGAQASALALQSVQVDALSQIVNGAVVGGVAAGFGLGARWLFRKDRADESCELGWFTGGILAALGAVGCGVFSIVQLTDFWNWTALFNPLLWLAHVALLKLGV